ncbi:hypothetical protein NX02_03215 [Sphingomonas sanxanigenens DSM 19645 = NX02]|uniref:Uncharacterized protein n=2 Tax=Sphingomonas sanxanigenens TaxID=397260 RepID=W0A7E0_9SPHN|nr:hypothetical protein NX02_03215 [Sphingomonas sanxanigenens DSM 19645 = NX02]
MRWLAPCSALLLAGCGMVSSFLPGDTKAALAEVRSAIVAHDYGVAVEQARALAIRHDDDPEVLFELARAEALLGNENRAVTALEKAIAAGLPGTVATFRDPAFDEIRRTVRFTAIAGRAAPQRLNRPVSDTPEVAATAAPTARAAGGGRRAASPAGDGGIAPLEPLKPLKPMRAGDVEIGDDVVRAGDVDLGSDF